MNCQDVINHSKLSKPKTINTPNLAHAKTCDWDYVYEPAEDSFLLLDALEKDLEFIYLRKPMVILEVGSGSGVIITALSQVLKSLSHCLAIDINPYACKLTKSTSNYNHAFVDVIRGDLTHCLRELSVDMIIFNPPYVVTPSDEVYRSDFLTKSWAGGTDGTEVINKFITLLRGVLSKNSFGYLLVLKENHPHQVMNSLKEKQFQCEIIAQRKVRGEELFVIKFINS